MKQNLGAMIIGVLLMVFGIGWLGNAFDLWHFRILDGWWTLLFILPGIAMIFNKGQRSIGIFLVLLGTILLLGELHILKPHYFWPTIISCGLIYAGGTIVYHAVTRKNKGTYTDSGYQYDYQQAPFTAEGTPKHGSEASYRQDWKEYRETQYQNYRARHLNAAQDFNKYPSYTAIFSGHDTICLTDDLMGMSGVAVFGGIDTDMSQVRVNRNIEMRLTAIFGGIDLVAPRGVNIVVDGFALFGGFDNNASVPYNPQWPTVYVHYFALFGGIDLL